MFGESKLPLGVSAGVESVRPGCTGDLAIVYFLPFFSQTGSDGGGIDGTSLDSVAGELK